MSSARVEWPEPKNGQQDWPLADVSKNVGLELYLQQILAALPFDSSNPVKLPAFAHWKVNIVPSSHAQLHICEEGFRELRERLASANKENPEFEEQYVHVVSVLHSAIVRLQNSYGDRLRKVVLVSDQLVPGIDLRDLSYYGAALYLVMDESVSPDALDELYDDISDTIFAQLDGTLFRLQVHLFPQKEWERLRHEAEMGGTFAGRTLTLLSRQ